jgi:negative regulator of genetic competence, sporulation and motility
MPIITRKANANTHPGRILLETQQPRRSKKQVEEDTDRARAAAIAEKEEKEANRRTVLATIADMEDIIEKSELDLRNHTTRPDLQHLHPDRERSLASKE